MRGDWGKTGRLYVTVKHHYNGIETAGTVSFFVP